MELELNIDTKFEIKSLMDLPRLGQVMKNLNLKINKSKLARGLGKDRRTIEKHLNGFIPKNKRNKPSKIDAYYEIIAALLSEDCPQQFYYMRVLWQYLTDNHGLQCSASLFRKYINDNEQFKAYFKEDKKISVPKGTARYETRPGYQAQLDWKESINYLTSDGEVIEVNVAVLVLSSSRMRVFKLTLTKTQKVLFNFLTEAFELLGGVPTELVTDNMKTVMDEARTKYTAGKVNVKFEEFAKDFNFKVRPCIAAQPRTKGKVETTMKLIDEIHAYQGKFTIVELSEYIEKLCMRLNQSVHQGTGKIPLLEFQKEKSHLIDLPRTKIRDSYKIKATDIKVNASNMISYKSNQYSVPSGYYGKKVKMQVYDNQLWIYSNIKLIAKHEISDKKLNYQLPHYLESLEKSFGTAYPDLNELALTNLKTMDEVFTNE